MSALTKKIGVLFGVLMSAACTVLTAAELSDDSLQYQDSLRDSYREQWVTTWTKPSTASPEKTNLFENQTIRTIVYISSGGQRFRIRISNTFGVQPLKIGAAQLAVQSSGAAIVPGTSRTLKFSGLSSINIPAGAVALSDPIDLSVTSQTALSVSIYYPTSTGPATYVEGINKNTYVTGAGNFTGAPNLPGVEPVAANYFLSAVEVSARKNSGVVVAIGDSVTSGATATHWPGFLFSRLNANYNTQKLSVVNQGIGCNRTLRDGCGPNASARFDRDVLAVTAATHVIVALGLVDIISPTFTGNTAEIATASDIIVGLKQLIERARAKGLKVYGATITPFNHSIFGVYTEENEATRKAVNRWIRTSGAYDGVIDFDKVVRDPADPTSFWPIYTVDGIHPNDAGNELMANTVDLALFQ
jgi:lysophospholipase L1-like esterase